MKRLIGLVLLVCLAFGCLGNAVADDLPEISFAAKDGAVNGGRTYELVLKSSVPVAQDTAVTVQCEANGENYEVVFAAGESEATLQIDTEVVEKRAALALTLAQGEGYQPAAKAKHTLTVHTLPKVNFYLTIHYGYVGKQMNVIVECSNPSSVLKNNNTFELRDQTGRVYATKTWNNPSERMTFKVDVTADMVGRRDFSVWCDGVRVSPEDQGYGALVDLGQSVLRQGETEEPYMSITLDCAYYDHQTDEILDILDKYNIKCTFFMTGYYVRTYTDSAKEIVARGHEVGNHSNTHPRMTEKSPYDALRQIQKPTEDIEAMLGVRVRLFRPPFGDYDKQVTALARAEGQEVVMWTIDSHDWDEAYKSDPSKVYKRVTKDVGPGHIILFHLDGFNTPEVLDQLIPYYQNELGLNPVPISELMAHSGRELPALPEMGTGEAAE